MRFAQCVLLVLFVTSVSFGQDAVTKSILEHGLGAAVEMGQEVKVSYKLFNEEGVLLDQVPESRPSIFKLGSDDVASGFSLGIEGMRLQEVRKVKIPPSLGQGASSSGNIPPDTTLILEVKLLKFGSGMAAEPLTPLEEQDGSLSAKYQNDRFLGKRHARDIKKPAMFEYLIRDFFTKPWRYKDSHHKILGDCLKSLAVLGALLAIYGIGLWRGKVKP